MYTTTSKAFPLDPKKTFPEYYPKAPGLSEKPFMMQTNDLSLVPRRTLKTTAYRENFTKPQYQGIQENPEALMNIRDHQSSEGLDVPPDPNFYKTR
jgi:hypothetical protein